MIKKIILSVLLISVLFMFYACSGRPSPSPESYLTTGTDFQKDMRGFDPSITDNGQGWAVYAEESNYKVLFNSNDLTYYYYIYNSEHKIVEEGGFSFSGRQLLLKQINNDIIRMHCWIGFGPGTAWSRYYSISRDMFSPVFWDTFDEYGDLVVYQSTRKTIVVQDMFDKQLFYKEIATYSYPLADYPAPFLTARFVNDGQSIEVTYLTEDSEIVRFTETVSLN